MSNLNKIFINVPIFFVYFRVDEKTNEFGKIDIHAKFPVSAYDFVIFVIFLSWTYIRVNHSAGEPIIVKLLLEKYFESVATRGKS